MKLIYILLFAILGSVFFTNKKERDDKNIVSQKTYKYDSILIKYFNFEKSYKLELIISNNSMKSVKDNQIKKILKSYNNPDEISKIVNYVDLFVIQNINPIIKSLKKPNEIIETEKEHIQVTVWFKGKKKKYKEIRIEAETDFSNQFNDFVKLLNTF